MPPEDEHGITYTVKELIGQALARLDNLTAEMSRLATSVHEQTISLALHIKAAESSDKDLEKMDERMTAMELWRIRIETTGRNLDWIIKGGLVGIIALLALIWNSMPK